MNSVALENDNFLDFCAAREGGQFSRHEIELQLALLLYTQRHFLIQETVRLSQQDTKLSFNSFLSRFSACRKNRLISPVLRDTHDFPLVN